MPNSSIKLLNKYPSMKRKEGKIGKNKGREEGKKKGRKEGIE